VDRQVDERRSTTSYLEFAPRTTITAGIRAA
jgi:hypothetical protein